MDKTEKLYPFEIKHPPLGDENYSWITEAFHRVATTVKDWVMNWEYLDAAVDVISFVFS